MGSVRWSMDVKGSDRLTWESSNTSVGRSELYCGEGVAEGELFPAPQRLCNFRFSKSLHGRCERDPDIASSTDS